VTPSGNQLSVTVANRRTEIERLGRLVDAFGEAHGLSGDVMFSVNLALDELITNVIRHGYDDKAEHRIAIRLTLDHEALLVEVEDDGRAFNPVEAPAADVGAPLDQRPIGGLGIHLVRALMDDLEYRRDGDRNIVILRKRVARTADSADSTD
jgi:anti-sigma regulatory factor (Ser/Thr protein kinase)